MWDVFELDRGAQVWTVGQDVDDAAIVSLDKLLEDETGELLMLGELLGAVAMSVGWQGALRRCIRGHHHASRRFAGLHAPNIGAETLLASRFSTEHVRKNF